MARSTSTQVAIPDTSSREVSERRVLLNLLFSLRPAQWTKNLLLFAGLLFGKRLFDAAATGRALAAFAIFCGLSGVVYLLNDLLDRDRDRRHPLKSRRPIASGALPVPTAMAAAAVIGGAAMAGALMVSAPFALVAATYVALLVLYSAVLKNIVIIDVLTIAVGFVLRAVAGAVAVGVEFSHWLLICTILLALFIALAKRRQEIVLLAGGATGHREILGEYSPQLLDQMIAVVTASTLVSYAFYTVSPETQIKFGTQWLGLTIPFPLYGIFRYLYLVHQRDGGGSPADLLLTDRPLLACVALWALAVALIIYRPLGL
jgi:4-hydroxybenzoate polyprenyltransferase